MTTPDEKVLALIERKARAGAHKAHLRECPDLKIEQPDISDGVYGCDTGCEYARLEALLTCPHGEREWYEYGTFGEIADLIAEMEAPPTADAETAWPTGSLIAVATTPKTLNSGDSVVFTFPPITLTEN